MREPIENQQATLKVDARQLKCPLPLLKLKQALNTIAVEESVHMVATDTRSLSDIKSFIQMTNHRMAISQTDSEIHFHVTKG